LHVLPASPATAARRRFVLPAVLMGVSGLAVAALAVLPPADARGGDVLVVQAAAPSAYRPMLVLPPHDVREPVRTPKVVKKPTPKAKPSPRVVKRASRRRVVAADLGPSGYFCPVVGKRSFSDDWGDARSGGRRHQGNDILAPYGASVVAVTAGTIHTDYSSNGGISLYLRGVDGVEYFYAHNSRNVATDGERVKAGQLIAYVGNTGNARGGPTHVHFERHPGGGAAVDPYPFLVRACR
jgi:murein DD-endopeptidase MepM/ murein hydrolase activator NlpD